MLRITRRTGSASNEQAIAVSTRDVISKFAVLLCALIVHSSYAVAEEENKQEHPLSSDSTEDAWKYRIRVGKLERQFSTGGDGEYGEWSGFIAVGKNQNTLWLTTKGSTQYGEADSKEIRLFYSRTIKPYIGVQLGWKRDLKPEPERDWFGFGLLGVLPYKIGADASFFIGESSRLAARLEVAYQHWFTQKLSLTPDLEANFYSEDDPDRGIGAGFSDLDLGLRLRYRITKGVSPYTGFTWKSNFGGTADMIESAGEDTSDLRIMLGVTLRI
jgi:copper resistance protein B